MMKKVRIVRRKNELRFQFQQMHMEETNKTKHFQIYDMHHPNQFEQT